MRQKLSEIMSIGEWDKEQNMKDKV